MQIDAEHPPAQATFLDKTYSFCSIDHMHSFMESPRIAYFSMEIGIASKIPTYSGGLGVLAGDTIRSCADLRIPFVGVTLVSRQGYLAQTLTDDGTQLDAPEPWDPSSCCQLLHNTVTVMIEGRDVKVQAWKHEHKSLTGGMVPLLFLDTDLEVNTPKDRAITNSLYGGDDRYRFKQELILGIGGVKMLAALNLNIKKYHMNEGHAAMLTLELLKKYAYDTNRVKNLCVFTTHTPVKAAMDQFTYSLVSEILKSYVPQEVIQKYGGQDRLNMTLLALNLSRYENGVTKAHMNYSRHLFPGHHINAITNGVHSATWTSPSFRALFDKYISGWAQEPALLVRVDEIPDDEIWDTHIQAKAELLKVVLAKTGVKLDPRRLTIGFARRATGYKRATLLFTDIDKLKAVNERAPIQLVFAGKAHPRDDGGKELIKDIYRFKVQLQDEIPVVYLENYDMNLAAQLVAGVDVWLNTPLPPYEASGTSGMKAAHNGVLNFSVLDGWWIEGCIEDVTGWAIGPPPQPKVDDATRRRHELEDLYNKLKYIILPTYFDERDAWIQKMKNAIGKVAFYFNSHRMMRRYITEAYLI
jgi:starch phosphorylase